MRQLPNLYSHYGSRGIVLMTILQVVGHRERILDVADLAAIPKGRAAVLASGNRPTLIGTQPGMTGPHAEKVKASLAAHDPHASRTIVDRRNRCVR